MIRVGDTILNEDYIAAIRPANDDGIFVPAEVATLTIVSLSSGEQVCIKAPMADASRALERAGFLEPADMREHKIEPWMMFTPGELDELRARYEQGFLFAAKDESGQAFAFSAMPTKGKASWLNNDSVSKVCRLRNSFDALSFEDEGPLDISNLLAGMEVDA